MNTLPRLNHRFSEVRAELRERRANRAAKLHLEREIAAYTSPNDRRELEEILDRHSDEETVVIREILRRQHAA